MRSVSRLAPVIPLLLAAACTAAPTVPHAASTAPAAPAKAPAVVPDPTAPALADGQHARLPSGLTADQLQKLSTTQLQPGPGQRRVQWFGGCGFFFPFHGCFYPYYCYGGLYYPYAYGGCYSYYRPFYY